MIKISIKKKNNTNNNNNSIKKKKKKHISTVVTIGRIIVPKRSSTPWLDPGAVVEMQTMPAPARSFVWMLDSAMAVAGEARGQRS